MIRRFSKVAYSLAVVCCPTTAFAYIDPGTGSIIIQGLVATIAAIGIAGKLYWQRIVRFFRREAPMRKESVDPDADMERDSLD